VLMRGRVKALEAPAEEPITTAEAKSHLKVDTDDEDTYIGTLIIAAREYAEGVLGRTLVSTRKQIKLDAFPENNGPIEIPLPPTIEIQSFAYINASGGSTSLVEDTDFKLVDGGDNEPAKVVPCYGKSWPAARAEDDAVTIVFLAGWEDADDVPQSIKQAILLLVAHWFENRESVNIGNIVNEVPQGVDALLWRNRIVTFA
jgi:uncharacterized phiE125 gp8 family phage protein